MIADLCKKHDVLCVSDEVYEWLIYAGEHIRIGKHPQKTWTPEFESDQ